jgi:hypothetical protein
VKMQSWQSLGALEEQRKLTKNLSHITRCPCRNWYRPPTECIRSTIYRPCSLLLLYVILGSRDDVYEEHCLSAMLPTFRRNTLHPSSVSTSNAGNVTSDITASGPLGGCLLEWGYAPAMRHIPPGMYLRLSGSVASSAGSFPSLCRWDCEIASGMRMCTDAKRLPHASGMRENLAYHIVQ